MQHNDIPEELVRFIQVLSEENNLKAWFLSLENLPDNVRSSELERMAIKMKSNNEDPPLISLVESLINKSIYDAILKTVKRLD